MDKKNKKDKEEKIIKPKGKILLRLLNLIALASCVFTSYNIFKFRNVGGKLSKYIYIAILVLFLLYLLLFMFVSKKLKKQRLLKRNIKKKGLYVSNIIYIIVTVLITAVLMYFYNYLGSFNKKLVTYSSSLITLSSNDIKDIKDVDDTIIGILSDKNSPEGYIIPKEVIKKYKLEDNNQIEEYDSYQEMLADLYSGDLDLMFITSDHVNTFSANEGYENIGEETKVVMSQSKELKKHIVSKRATSSKGKSVTEPFTILLIGLDSETEGLSSASAAHGDSLILITFNPKTLNATVLSIPRDSYVPIACWSGKPENKITHAAVYGTDCLMDTIENYFGIKIDYYAQINFKGLVSLVNAMGGIDVEVPQDLCTNDSDRNQEICIKGGWQHLDGEGALVLSRNRKQLQNGDIGRGQNQQLVIQAMVNKVRKIRSAKDFMKILDTISDNFDTNFTTEQIISFYSVAEDIVSNGLAKDDADLVNIEQLYLQGSGQMIYDERANMVLWDYVPSKSSRDDIVNAMKVNLGLKDKTVIKKFDFSINEEYEKEIIGYAYRGGSLYSLVPNFVGLSKDQASSLASRSGVKVTFDGNSGYVVSQSAPVSKRIDLLSGSVKLTLSGSNTDKEDDTKDKKKKDAEEKKSSKDKDEKDDTSSGSGSGSGSGESGSGSGSGESGAGTGESGSGSSSGESGAGSGESGSGSGGNSSSNPGEPTE